MRQLRISKSFTSREENSLDKYLREIGKEERITAEEEVELAHRIKKGDEFARDRLIRANLRFVVSVAKQYQNRGLPLTDLINEGNFGLAKAVDRFDETTGFKFISYGVWWIRQSIIQALAEQSRVVRLPLNQIGLLGRINKSTSKFTQENEREPSTEELAEYLELPLEKIRDTIRVSGRQVSFDAPFGEEEDNCLLDIFADNNSLSPDKTLMIESLKIEVDRVLCTLSQKEAIIIRMHYFDNKTLEEVADNLGFTRERIRQIKEKTERKLRNHFRSKNLKQFLG